MSEQIFTNCTNAGPISAYVRDGKVTRVRPLVADENDTPLLKNSISLPMSTVKGRGFTLKTG
jgi:hypothetical protein